MSMFRAKNSIGDHYEEKAAKMLNEQGLKILMRNFSAKTGEIDIIALDGDTLVFVEVRSRSNPRFVSAAASIDSRKQKRIARTALLFLQRYKKWSHLPCRFDVVAYEPRQSNSDETGRWIRSAFTA